LLTLVAGNEIYRDGQVSGIDESEFRQRIDQVRIKINSTTGL
jgi:hypothetical protein